MDGDKLGRTFGYPTANLKVEKYKLIPGNGVYVVKVFIGDEVFKGLLSIGTRPTVTNTDEKELRFIYLILTVISTEKKSNWNSLKTQG